VPEQSDEEGKISSESKSMDSAKSFDSDLSSDELMEGDDPEENIHQYFQNFYENKYHDSEIHNIADYIHEKVWNLHFDENHDVFYLFKAKIVSVEGDFLER
jgi:hypothetical protein